jgi:hypothetical protein
MKTNFILLFLFIGNLLYGQTAVKWSTELTAPKSQYFGRIYKKGNNFYQSMYDYNAWTKKEKNYLLKGFDENLTPIKDIVIKLPASIQTEGTYFEGMIPFKEGFLMFGGVGTWGESSALVSSNTYDFYFWNLNLDGTQNTPVKLYSGKANNALYNVSFNDYDINGDSTKILGYVAYSYKKEVKLELETAIADLSNNTVTKNKKYTLPTDGFNSPAQSSSEDFHTFRKAFIHGDNIYAVIDYGTAVKEGKDWVSSKRKIRVYKINIQSDNITFVDSDNIDERIVAKEEDVRRNNNSIYYTVPFRDKKFENGYKGIYTYSFDLTTDKGASFVNSFDKNFILCFSTEKDIAAGKGMKFESGSNIHPDYFIDGDNLIVISEDGRSTKYTTRTKNSSGLTTSYFTSYSHVYKDIMVNIINLKNGKMINHKIPKNQQTTSDGGIFSSYSFFSTPDNYCIIFNDKETNQNKKCSDEADAVSGLKKQSAYLVKISKTTGSQTKKLLFKNDIFTLGPAVKDYFTVGKSLILTNYEGELKRSFGKASLDTIVK